MGRAFKLFKTNKELTYKSAYHPGYKYDRVTFQRVEHRWKTSHFYSVYSYDTSVATYVGFGAAKSPLIPTLIMTDHDGAFLFGRSLDKQSWSEGEPSTTAQVT